MRLFSNDLLLFCTRPPKLARPVRVTAATLDITQAEFIQRAVKEKLEGMGQVAANPNSLKWEVEVFSPAEARIFAQFYAWLHHQAEEMRQKKAAAGMDSEAQPQRTAESRPAKASRRRHGSTRRKRTQKAGG